MSFAPEPRRGTFDS